MADNKDNAPRRKTLDESLKAIKDRAEAGRQAAEQKAAETPKQMFLPGFDIGAMPNHLNRSSLIAPIARGKRKTHSQTVMVTRSDCVLEYSGQQLDEADGDLIMALIAFARPYALGTPVPLNRKELLRKIKPGGILIYDGYGVMNPPQRKDITIYRIDAMDKAAEMKNSKVFNMIVLGGLLKVCPVVSTDGLNKALYKSLPERHHGLIPLNMQAVEEGMKIIEKVD